MVDSWVIQFWVKLVQFCTRLSFRPKIRSIYPNKCPLSHLCKRPAFDWTLPVLIQFWVKLVQFCTRVGFIYTFWISLSSLSMTILTILKSFWNNLFTTFQNVLLRFVTQTRNAAFAHISFEVQKNSISNDNLMCHLANVLVASWAWIWTI